MIMIMNNNQHHSITASRSFLDLLIENHHEWTIDWASCPGSWAKAWTYGFQDSMVSCTSTFLFLMF